MKVNAQECQILFDEKGMYYGTGKEMHVVSHII